METHDFTIEAEPFHASDAPDDRTGRIRIGAFEERFELVPVPTPGTDMPAAWRRELERLVAGASAVALRTSPPLAFILYRDGEQVFVQQMLVQAPGWPGTFDDAGCIRTIPARTTRSDDGRAISEWRTTVDTIERFIERTAVR